MKRLFLLAVVSASLAGCATAPPNGAAESTASQDPNGVSTEQPYRVPRASVGIGLGNWGRGSFGGIGIGLGF